MLTHDEVVDLLTAISAYDNRKPNPASILAWGKAAEIGRWTFREALDAVHKHFAENTDYLMPAHVGNRIRDARQDRALREAGQEMLTAANADTRVLEAATQLARRLAIPEQFRPNANQALRVKCPHCDASVNQACTRPGRGGLRECPPHPSRVELAAREDVA
jgi:hypothetical protein